MSLCDCPNDPALNNIVDFECPIDFSEITKLIFSRKKPFQKTGVPPLLEADILDLAEWVDTLAAVDDTKSW